LREARSPVGWTETALRKLTGERLAAAPDLEHVLPLLKPGGRKLHPTHRFPGWHRAGWLTSRGSRSPPSPPRAIAAEGFLGTATELLGKLAERADDAVIRRKDWPADGTRLSHELRRPAPNLRAVGVETEFGIKLKSSRRGIALRTLPQPSVASGPSVQPAFSGHPRWTLPGR
jgi:hypothetical protein